jgi:hypothetical protein
MPAEVLDLSRGTWGEGDHMLGLGSKDGGLDSSRARASWRSRITWSPEMIRPAASSASLSSRMCCQLAGVLSGIVSMRAS